MRPVDEALDIDAEFRFPPTKFRTRRFNNWEDVAKIAFEVHLDEMRTLLELHYDDVSSSHAMNSRRKRKGGVFASIAYAHRHHLNQKLILPTRASASNVSERVPLDNILALPASFCSCVLRGKLPPRITWSEVKNILRKPADEARRDKLQMLLGAVKCEVEREEEVFMNSEEDIEKLACAVEASTSTACGFEVGPGFKAIPPGAQIQISDDALIYSTVEEIRTATAAVVRALPVGAPLSVKFRPMCSPRTPPLDLLGRELMWATTPWEAFPEKTAQEVLDNMLVVLWDGLFCWLPWCERGKSFGMGGKCKISLLRMQRPGFSLLAKTGPISKCLIRALLARWNWGGGLTAARRWGGSRSSVECVRCVASFCISTTACPTLATAIP